MKALMELRAAREAADELIRRREAEVARHERCRCGSRDMYTKRSRGREYATDKCKACYSTYNRARMRNYRMPARTPFTSDNVRRVVVRAAHGWVTWYHGFDEQTVHYRHLKVMNTPKRIIEFYQSIGYELVEKRDIGKGQYYYALERHNAERRNAA